MSRQSAPLAAHGSAGPEPAADAAPAAQATVRMTSLLEEDARATSFELAIHGGLVYKPYSCVIMRGEVNVVHHASLQRAS